MFEMEIDGAMLAYELVLEYDDQTEEYVACYLIDGDEHHVGRGSSVNRAVSELATHMNADVNAALGEGV